MTAILIIIPFFSSEKQSKNRVRLPVCLRDSAGRLRDCGDWGLRLCVCGTQAFCLRDLRELRGSGYVSAVLRRSAGAAAGLSR